MPLMQRQVLAFYKDGKSCDVAPLSAIAVHFPVWDKLITVISVSIFHVTLHIYDDLFLPLC